ncbi:ATPase family AAA domain-containing protein 3 [Colletotrichum siamense]|uniref:ATPase family AAA domain-containing protein 3 n=1 Tax=Colletotrichum siamense TaxID=690259 RepID=A0A9P5EZ44_COLSI|nr:ATPase family AAA domain-containing protein 3 [Colletotrichum siamense]KAF4863421.1 ATPase family AAA domain-containing protein 3 [Colletotrichum siamense]
MCRLLDVSPHTPDDELLEAMESASDSLRDSERLKYRVLQQQGPPKCEIINKIYCHHTRTENLYLDEPWVVESGPFNAHLRGSHAVPHLELHLERNKEITFIVYRRFECCGVPPPKDFNYHGRVTSLLDSDPSSFLKAEHISLISEELSDRLREVAERVLVGIPHPKFNRQFDDKIAYPYLWWFHRRHDIEEFTETLPQSEKQHLAVFQQYIHGRLAKDWGMVDSLLGSGRITAEYIQYLFVPNKVLISKTEGSNQHQLRGVIATHWLEILPSSAQGFKAVIPVSTWEFRGTFHQVQQKIIIDKLPECDVDGSFAVSDLMSVYPIEYATSETVQALEERGRMFWKCRHRNYVSSSRFSDDSLKASPDSRFMVDYRTYSQMHPSEEPISDDHTGYEITHGDFDHDDNSFFMCLPTRIPGFNMQKKEWVSLDVEFINDVEWNDQAFEHLVIDTETKELVKAVVTTQLRAEENTDLIRGKGNGLFILLHGGPGTGKTLTAESVAEIAKKPLYRVTCGDIGTKAEEVEKYLDTVLLLGKIWGCVVLLDEADVFLEERTLKNLERNALVSVFLRVLEYYDGILILTSNRVGTFDEAFKSRIQLNLRYKNLNEQQRLQIWTNFIDRIETLDRHRITSSGNSKRNGSFQQDVGINSEEIRQHLPELATANLNGRQIRNVISTARQLAVYRKMRLGYEHIACVIGEASKFDEYMKELSQGYTADDIRRGRRER